VNFLYPLFLIAAATLAIPVIIHLFNFRKFKKVAFPDIRFLREIQEQTRKSSRLKHLLILLCRLLAVGSLVLAFAQPFLNKDREKMQGGPKAVSIYIDNSYSMGIEKGSLSLFDLGRAKARQLIESGSTQDVYQILTNDFAYNENRFLPRAEALQHLSTLTLSAKSRKAETILEKQKQLLGTEPGALKQLVYISDFQKSGFPAQLSLSDSIRKTFVSVNATQLNNLCIDTVLFETPSLQLNTPNPLTVKLRNNGTEEVNTSLTLMVNGQLKSVVNTSLKAGERKSESMVFTTATAGPQKMQLFLNDYPVSFDDTFYMAGKVHSNYSVLVLNQSNANAFLSSVFRPGTQFRVDNHQVQQVNPELLKNYSLVILNGANNLSPALLEGLKNYTLQGGSLLVFPPSGGSTAGINELVSKLAGVNFLRVDTARTSVSDFNRSHEIFRDLFVKTPENIDLPQVFKHYLLSSSALSSLQKLFSFSNGEVFLSASRVGNGKLYLCTSAAEASWSSFPKSYWFLPILYKMAFVNTTDQVNALTLGRQSALYIDNQKVNDKTVYHIGGQGYDAIPEQGSSDSRVMINVNQAVQHAGLYGIYLPGSQDTVFTGINYDRNESDLSYWSIQELKQQSKVSRAEWLDGNTELSAGLHDLQSGMPLWKVCIILALLFLLTEALLIRLMK